MAKVSLTASITIEPEAIQESIRDLKVRLNEAGIVLDPSTQRVLTDWVMSMVVIRQSNGDILGPKH